jgi:hypothetical protein
MSKANKTYLCFGRHETFGLRFGWITKGYMAWCNNPKIFEDEDATVALGVGKNMVHAIRYWLIASQVLMYQDGLLVSSSLGREIFNIEDGYDPYLEDDATIWLLHWLIASNSKNATAFFWFFNRFHKPEFTQKELFEAIREFLKENTNAKISDNTLNSDISVILRMYEPTIANKNVSSEEGLDSPMSLLGLISEVGDTKFHESKLENKWNLPIAPFSYAVLNVFEKRDLSSLPIEQLMFSEGFDAVPGAVFRLNDQGLIAKLEEMIAWLPGVFELRETAGIHQLYKLRQMKPIDVISKYYSDSRNSLMEQAA